MPAQGASFKSPLRSFRAEGGEFQADAQAHLGHLVQWRKDLASSASFEVQQSLRDLCHEREHLKDLRADLAGVQGLVESASQLQAGGVRLADVVQSSTAAAATRAQALARVRDELFELHESQREKLQEEQQGFLAQRSVADKQHAEALKLLNVYKDRLGLEIKRVAPGTVRMAFSMIDASEPTREFSFTLGLGDLEDKTSEGYLVRECAPDVPELQQLLTDLNSDASSTTALPRFVCSIRRAFLKMIGAERKSC